SIQHALGYINEFPGQLDEDLISLKTFCQLGSQQDEESVVEYFKYVKHIDDLNVVNFCGYLIPVIKSNVIEKEKLGGLLAGVSFSKLEFKELVCLMFDTLYQKGNPVEIGRIYDLTERLSDEPKLFFFIVLIFFENKYFLEC